MILHQIGSESGEGLEKNIFLKCEISDDKRIKPRYQLRKEDSPSKDYWGHHVLRPFQT